MHDLRFYVAVILYSTFANGSAKKNCLSVEPVKNFQAEKALGHWYLIESSANRYLVELKCWNGTLTSISTNKLRFQADSIIVTDLQTISQDGNFTFICDQNTAAFLESFEEMKIEDIVITKIIGTDYDTYIIFHVCSLNRNKESIYILSRTRRVNEDFYPKVHDIVEKKGVSIRNGLIPCNQEDCPN